MAVFVFVFLQADFSLNVLEAFFNFIAADAAKGIASGVKKHIFNKGFGIV